MQYMKIYRCIYISERGFLVIILGFLSLKSLKTINKNYILYIQNIHFVQLTWARLKSAFSLSTPLWLMTAGSFVLTSPWWCGEVRKLIKIMFNLVKEEQLISVSIKSCTNYYSTGKSCWGNGKYLGESAENVLINISDTIDFL